MTNPIITKYAAASVLSRIMVITKITRPNITDTNPETAAHFAYLLGIHDGEGVGSMYIVVELASEELVSIYLIRVLDMFQSVLESMQVLPYTL